MESEIAKFYEKSNVFITGATGFFGKVIIQKLLRTCDIEHIYILVRNKKGKSAAERKEQLFSDPIFECMKTVKPNYDEYIHVVEGDLSLSQLGLNGQDRQLLKDKINIVFHCGASLNMSEKLKEAIYTNVRGTKYLIELCYEMKNLKSVVVVSTAYSNCHKTRIEERFEDVSLQSETLLDLTDQLDADDLEKIKDVLLDKRPNPYVYSKAASENLIKSHVKKLPIGIFRPSIVLSTLSDPIPGWTDNIYGPVGLMAACGVGILRVLNIDGDNILDMVPVDLCINALICVAKDVHNKFKQTEYEEPIYNCSSGTKLGLSWRKFCNLAAECHVYPLKDALWKHSITLIKSKIMYFLANIFMHIIPGYIFDTLFVLTGRKRIVSKVYTKIDKLMSVLSYFHQYTFEIKNTNINRIWNNLNDVDKKLFPFNMGILKGKEKVYMSDVCVGIKVYILKETLDTVEEDRKRYARLVFLHYVVKASCYTFLAWIFYKLFSICYATCGY